jgi:hypothetical protein
VYKDEEGERDIVKNDSRFLVTLRVYKSEIRGTVTSSFIFRRINSHHSTLIFDVFDVLMKTSLEFASVRERRSQRSQLEIRGNLSGSFIVQLEKTTASLPP